MGVVKTHVEAFSPVPAHKMFKGFFLSLLTIVPQLLPQYFKSVEILSGDGGVGSVFTVKLAELGNVTRMTQRVDIVDKEKMIFQYTIIDGDIRLGILDTIICHFEVRPTHGGCIVTKSVAYIPKNYSDEIPKWGVEQANMISLLILRSVESHILANPKKY